jgi:methionyl-tRNA formyltransferase
VVNTATLRVLFFGTPDFAVPTLNAIHASRHSIVGVVTQPDKPRGRGQQVTHSPVKAAALGHGLTVYQPTALRDPAWLATVRDTGADIGVVAAYGRILPHVLLDALPHGFINVHASLLPRWRGAAPIHRAVIAGDPVTGVTIMRVVLALDAGPMLARVETPVASDDTSNTVERRLAEQGATLLVDTLDRLAIGPVVEQPQHEADVTYATRLERSESRIDWTTSAADIDRRVRGLQPWPLAVARIGDRAVALLHSHVVTPDGHSAPPGTVVAAKGDQWHIACGRGVLAVTQVKPEGKRPMAIRDFLNGAPVRVGQVIT